MAAGFMQRKKAVETVDGLFALSTARSGARSSRASGAENRGDRHELPGSERGAGENSTAQVRPAAAWKTRALPPDHTFGQAIVLGRLSASGFA